MTVDPMRGIDGVLKKIGFHSKKEWKRAEPVWEKHSLQILGQPVMEDWEEPYMQALASIVTASADTVLEVGFGMGISAGFITQAKIKKHIIIEANHAVAQKAREFARGAGVQTKVIEGLWEDVIEKIPDGSADAILFDTYPLSGAELRNHFPFFPFAHRKLRVGGVFTYFSDEEHMYQPEHLEHLMAAGFPLRGILGALVHVDTPKDCLYWHWKTILAPIVLK